MPTNEQFSSDILEEVRHTEDWTDDDGEVRELTAADIQRMKPFSSLPPDLQHILREIQSGNVTIRPDAVPEEKTEERVPVPIARSVAERFQASGQGWESKVDEALRQWLDEHQAS